MSTHTYVDETKAKGYVVVAATAAPEQFKVARKELTTILLSGQRSLHMKSESTARRHAISDTVVAMGVDLGIEVVVYDAGRAGSELERRARCLRALVEVASASAGVTRVTFDLDQTLLSWDRQQLIELTRASGGSQIEYAHMARHQELLLAIPDIVAWSWAKGGECRKRVAPVIAKAVTVP